MALMPGLLHRHPGIFHALIFPLSGLYLTGIPVFELLQGREGCFPFLCFPLYPDAFKVHISRKHSVVNMYVSAPARACDFAGERSKSMQI